jgi:hypothetical protein
MTLICDRNELELFTANIVKINDHEFVFDEP